MRLIIHIKLSGLTRAVSSPNYKKSPEIFSQTSPSNGFPIMFENLCQSSGHLPQSADDDLYSLELFGNIRRIHDIKVFLKNVFKMFGP